MYRVTFAGHREICRFNEIEIKLYDIIANLIKTKEYVEFYVGNNGDFDTMVISSIRFARKKIREDNSSLNLVLYCQNADVKILERQFDSVIIPEILYNIHPKRKITARNQWMVENCDLLVCYVERSIGGAANALEYAKKIGNVDIINVYS